MGIADTKISLNDYVASLKLQPGSNLQRFEDNFNLLSPIVAPHMAASMNRECYHLMTCSKLCRPVENNIADELNHI